MNESIEPRIEQLRQRLLFATSEFRKSLDAAKDGEERSRLRLGQLQMMGEILTEADREFPGITDDYGRTACLGLLTAWPATSPMVVTDLIESGGVLAGDVKAGQLWVDLLTRYLDVLLRCWPGLGPNRVDAAERIVAAVRRAFITCREVSGSFYCDAIRASSSTAEASAAARYRRVIAVLQQFLVDQRRFAQPELITNSIHLAPLTGPVHPPVDRQRGWYTREIQLYRIPKVEVDSVHRGVLRAAGSLARQRRQALSTSAAPTAPPETGSGEGNEVLITNAVWTIPLEIWPEEANGAYRAVYELRFDHDGAVSVDRLHTVGGRARRALLPRQEIAAFNQLDNDGKRTELMRRFGLAGVADGHAQWTDGDLAMLLSMFSRVPAEELRAILAGVTLVREGATPQDRPEAGVTHSGPDQTLDHGLTLPPPPHIHLYQDTFDANHAASPGTPGDAGLGAEHTLMHELAHMRVDRWKLAHNRSQDERLRFAEAFQSCQQQVSDLWATLPPAARKACNAWTSALNEVQQPVITLAEKAHEHATGKIEDDPERERKYRAQLDAHRERARKAAAALAAAREGLDAPDPRLPADLLKQATAVVAAVNRRLDALDELLRWSIQIQTFTRHAAAFGYGRCTEYAAASDEEWFAESYALYYTDPYLLCWMNWRIFRWFEDGLPTDLDWKPAAL